MSGLLERLSATTLNSHDGKRLFRVVVLLKAIPPEYQSFPKRAQPSVYFCHCVIIHSGLHC